MTLALPHGTATRKARARRRARERGAIVFITAMTLAVLASLGLFALVTSASEIKTAGAVRQNSQSHYLGESGVVATTYQLTTASDVILPIMRLTPDYDSGQPRNLCWSLASVPSTSEARSKACKILNYRPPQFDLNAHFVGSPSFDKSQLFDNTLYPTAYNPEIRIEITDPVKIGSLPGYDTAGPAPCTATVTTYGETLPSTGFGSAGLEVGRARVTFLAIDGKCP